MSSCTVTLKISCTFKPPSTCDNVSWKQYSSIQSSPVSLLCLVHREIADICEEKVYWQLIENVNLWVLKCFLKKKKEKNNT